MFLQGYSRVQNYLKTVTYIWKWRIHNISESESAYDNNSEYTESHSKSDFFESNDKLLVKPNPLPQPLSPLDLYHCKSHFTISGIL